MKFCLSLFIFIFVAYSFAQQNESQLAIEKLSKDSNLTSASISFFAYDLKKEAVVASFDPKRCLVPASTTKLWSTATALEILGSSYVPKTEVYYTGEITKEGVLKGDIIIKGFGDLTLGSQYFRDRENMRDFFKEWMNYFPANNIRFVEGNVIADASALGYFGVPDGWSWSDMGNYYGAFPSGLTIFDNMMELYFQTAAQSGGSTQITSTNPHIEDFKIQNFVTSDNISSDNAYVFAAPYSSSAFVTGTLPLNQSKFVVKAAIQNPELFFAQEFQRQLQAIGVGVSGLITGKKLLIDTSNDDVLARLSRPKKLLFTHYGDGIIQIINLINQRSINLYAEHLIHWIALEKSNFGDHKTGMNVLRNYWSTKIDLQSARITDGSGLSRSNSISAYHFVELLKYMQKNTYFENSLPISAETGTLKNLCKDQKCSGRIKAKSGSIAGVKAYAGYAYSENGNKIAFAIIINNYQCSSTELTKLLTPVLNTLVS